MGIAKIFNLIECVHCRFSGGVVALLLKLFDQVGQRAVDFLHVPQFDFKRIFLQLLSNSFHDLIVECDPLNRTC